MKLKNILAFGALGYFTYKGVTKLMKYDKGQNGFVDTITDIGKDAIDGVNNIVTIFSNNQDEKDACDSLSELTKAGIDTVVSTERRIYE